MLEALDVWFWTSGTRTQDSEAKLDSTQSVPEGGQVEALLGLTGFSICGHKQSQYNCKQSDLR